ncbi:MAG: alpha/beta fold hydrolase [Oscillochloridaceae bacterium umkhey_bin13]
MDNQNHGLTSSQPDLQALRHELRTPVNHIIGFSEMLLEDLDEPGPFAALAEVVAAGKAILAIISDLLGSHEVAPVPDALVTLAPRLLPHLETITHTCEGLVLVAEREGPAAFVDDLLKIVGAAAYLGDVAAGTAGPLAQQAAAEVAAIPAPHLNTPSAAPVVGRILIVDDNTMNREMLARRLERLGYHPDQAADGQLALAALRTHPYDLVLLDLLMPELDGFGVLAAMKADPALQPIAVIVLSALDDTDSVVRAIDLGADDYLPKPFDPVLLKARIGACLFKKNLRDLEREYLRRIEDAKRRADDLLHVVIPLGVSLVGERDFNLMLETIVLKAQDLTRAEGGTLYLRTDDERLRFMIVRNTVLDIAMGGASGKDIPFPPLRLYDETTDLPLLNYVVTHAALTGQPINIPDAYDVASYDFSGTREFDARTGYRTTSVLNIPLRDSSERVIGVLQLINARDAAGAVIPFDPASEQMIVSLGQLAAAALAAYARERQLQQEISELKIEIDEVKKQREISSITGSLFFSDLQERARAMRSKTGSLVGPERETGAQRRVYTVGEQTIVAREQGPERGRLILLIHGWSSSWYALSPLMHALSDRYRCVAVDLPGYGESPPLKSRATIPAYADLLIGLLTQLSPGLPAMVIGHSMGGMTAVTMALRHRDLLERMVLICPTISGQLSFWINTFISPITMLERSHIAGGVLAQLEPYMLTVTDRLMRPASFAQRSGINEADYHRLRADARRPGQGRVRAECFWAMRENDLSGQIGEVTIPSLVIWGMEDNTVPLRDASLLADEWPAAELRVLPKAGHWPQFETPDATRKAVRSFLAMPIKLLKSQLR